MIDVVKLEKALDRVLDVAIDPECWGLFLEEVAAATNSYAAIVLPVLNRVPNAVFATANISGAVEEYFRDGWLSKDWNIHALPFLLRDGIARTQQFTPPEVFKRHDFYHFMARHQIGHSCLIEWHAVPSELVCLVLHRKLDQLPFSEEEATALLAIRDRLMLTARMAYSISRNRVTGTIVGLDIAGMAAVFFNRLGKITLINKTARKIIDPHLQIVDDELRSTNKAETARIRLAIETTLAQQKSGSAENVETVLIERNDQKPLMLRVQHLNGGSDLFAHSVGLCLIEAPEQQRTAPPQVLKHVFDLTEQEATIVTRLCEGLSLREISQATGRSYETIRTHMKSILNKTGTSRQGELIALVAKMNILESSD